MALAFPYPLAGLWDLLDPSTITVDLKRFDEESGSGDGRVWSAELSRPLWEVSADLIQVHWDEARHINAKFRSLCGTKHPLLFSDPTHIRGLELPGAITPTISSITADRTGITIAGLPPNWQARAGDMFSIEWGSGRYFMAELSEGYTANSSGVLQSTSIMPYLPLGINVGAAINMRTPTMKMFVPKGGFKPYSFAAAHLAGGASIRMLQRP